MHIISPFLFQGASASSIQIKLFAQVVAASAEHGGIWGHPTAASFPACLA
jgi:hypothetical protein